LEQSRLTFGSKPVEKLWAILQWFHPVETEVLLQAKPAHCRGLTAAALSTAATW
jgi:hypothetical protein